MYNSKRNQLLCQSHLFYGCIVLSLFLMVASGCKKTADVQQEPKAAPAANAQAAGDNAPNENKPEAAADKDAAQAVQAATPQADAEKAANPGAPAPKPDDAQAAPLKKCEKWGKNPMFQDGHVFNYEVKIERAACCDLDKDDPEWECDEDGMCELNKTASIQCKASLTHTESYFCGSTITCTDSKGRESLDFPAGHWFIDSNGIYHFVSEKKMMLNKQTAPGNCQKTENIQCKPETLAYEYSEFGDEEPLIPFAKADIHRDECDEGGDFCNAFHLTHKDTIWARETSADGGDSSSDAVTLDETKGITSFKNDFSGGSEQHIEGKLK